MSHRQYSFASDTIHQSSLSDAHAHSVTTASENESKIQNPSRQDGRGQSLFLKSALFPNACHYFLFISVFIKKEKNRLQVSCCLLVKMMEIIHNS